MRKSNFTEAQIVDTLNQVETGRHVKGMCRKPGISKATYFAWKSKFVSMEAADTPRLRGLEVEHSKLKRMYAELAMENHALFDNGPKFIAIEMAQWTQGKGVELDIFEPDRPMQNSFIERFNGS
jgi:hypothetical protein